MFETNALASIRAVLFDLDNTLYDHIRASREALIASARAFEGTAALDGELLCREFTRHNDDCWELAIRGEMTRDELAVVRFRRTLDTFDVRDLAAERFSEAYLTRYRRHAAEVPGARAAVLRLRECVPVGVVTNGFPDLVQDKLEAIGLAGMLHPVIVADRLEVMKPRPHCFLAGVEALRVPAEQVLFVGDSLTVDVAGASSAGLCTCWFNPQGAARPADAPVPDLTVRRLEEVPELLL